MLFCFFFSSTIFPPLYHLRIVYRSCTVNVVHFGTRCTTMHTVLIFISLDRFSVSFFSLFYVCYVNNNVCTTRSPLAYTVDSYMHSLNARDNLWLIRFLFIFSSFMVCMISTMAAFNNSQPSAKFVFSWSWLMSEASWELYIKYLASVVPLMPVIRLRQMRRVWNLEFRAVPTNTHTCELFKSFLFRQHSPE